MTFRAKPVVKRDHRPAWESQDRRNFYLNLGFGLVVVLARRHPRHRRRAVLVQRAPRLGRQRRRRVDHQGRVHRPLRRSRPGGSTRPRAGSGPRSARRPPDRGPGAIAAPDHRSSSRSSSPRSRSSGSSTPSSRRSSRPRRASPYTDEDIDARLVTEATTPESRHAWVIEVEPETSTPARWPDRPPRRPRPRPRPTRRSRTSRAARPGRTSPDRLDRHVDRTAGRRPRLAPEGRRPDRRGVHRPRSSRQPAGRRPRSSRATTASTGSVG